MYETQTELSEAREELELVKLKLDVADQEAQAAKRQAAEATAALLQAQASPGILSPVNRRSLSREVCSDLHTPYLHNYLPTYLTTNQPTCLPLPAALAAKEAKANQPSDSKASQTLAKLLSCCSAAMSLNHETDTDSWCIWL